MQYYRRVSFMKNKRNENIQMEETKILARNECVDNHQTCCYGSTMNEDVWLLYKTVKLEEMKKEIKKKQLLSLLKIFWLYLLLHISFFSFLFSFLLIHFTKLHFTHLLKHHKIVNHYKNAWQKAEYTHKNGSTRHENTHEK